MNGCHNTDMGVAIVPRMLALKCHCEDWNAVYLYRRHPGSCRSRWLKLKGKAVVCCVIRVIC